MEATPNTALATSAADSAALAIPADEVQIERDELQALAKRLPPAHTMRVLALKRPFPAEFGLILQSLPSEIQVKVVDLIDRTRPGKAGLHTQYENFTPTEIKVFHGTGADALRPKNCIPGQFYTAASQILEAPFDGAILGAYTGRAVFPPREGDGAGKNPICVSHDRVMGTKYGACAKCHLAFKKWNEGGCIKDVVVYLVDRDLTGIYSLRFTRTSTPAGEALIKLLQRSKNTYDRWIRFETQERVDGDKRWYVIKAAPVSDTKTPANNEVVKELHPLLNAFSRLLDREVYYPTLANVYTRAESAPAAIETAAGETANIEELTGAAGTSSESPDFSA